jgi:translation initiation factor IF-2
MGKIRIYELAKELGVENRAIIAKAVELGLSAKSSHSHSLDADEAEKIRRAISRGPATNGAHGSSVTERTARDVKTGATVTVRRQGNIIRRRKADEGRGGDAETDDTTQESLVAGAGADALFESHKGHEERESVTQEFSSAEATEALDIDTTALAPENTVDVVDTAAEIATGRVEDSGVVADSAGPVPIPSEDTKKSNIGPRVLGKIELPRKKLARVETVRTGDKVAAPAVFSDDDQNKRKGFKEKKPKRREFSRGQLVDYDSMVMRRTPKRRGKGDGDGDLTKSSSDAKTMKASKRVVEIDEVITVGELAKAMSLKVSEVVGKLMQLGVLATINQPIDFDTASIVADEFGFTVQSVAYDEASAITATELNAPQDEKPRSPVVTVMGHVDHGKTTLLDTIRKASVAAKEHGGITQHIGAYKVVVQKGDTGQTESIAFIDTPGHEAFTSMRARGAKVTDIVILVVAADDGVMPQTREAINHAKAADVPIIVAINKIDKQGGNPDRIKQELSELGLTPEDWGGDTMYYPVSALKGQGIKELLEGVLLLAEVKQLKANPNRRAIGTVVEARTERGMGYVVTVLVQQGTLRVGDAFVMGAESGRIRSMNDHNGERLEEAGPSSPVEITGLTGVPEAGDDFYVVESDSVAREISQVRALKRQRREMVASGGPLTLEQFAKMAASQSQIELALVIKGDVQGSVEAVTQAVEKLSGNKVRVRVVHSGVGGITESDIKLAQASKAIVVGFGVRAEPRAARDAESIGVELRFYNIIYDLTDDIKKAMTGLLDPIKQEKHLGRVEVRNTFTVSKIGTIAGCHVVEGMVKRGAGVRLLRDNRVIHEGKMSSLRRFKDDVREVQTGFECGIGIERFNDIKVGDVIDVFEMQEIPQTLD